MRLTPHPLTAEAFAPFGEVLELSPLRPGRLINEGFTERFDDLAALELGRAGGRPSLHLFRTRPKPLPFRVRALERHPLGSQTFIPLSDTPFLVLVASAEAAAPRSADLALFISSGRQGVSYRADVWHHYNLALERVSDFAVLERAGPGENLELCEVSEEVWVALE